MAGTLALALSACGSGGPSAQDEDAFLHEYTAAVIRAGEAAGRSPKPLDETLAGLSEEQKRRGIDIGHQACESLREGVDAALARAALSRAVSSGAGNPDVVEDEFRLAVRYLCPDLEATLNEVLPQL